MALCLYVGGPNLRRPDLRRDWQYGGLKLVKFAWHDISKFKIQRKKRHPIHGGQFFVAKPHYAGCSAQSVVLDTGYVGYAPLNIRGVFRCAHQPTVLNERREGVCFTIFRYQLRIRSSGCWFVSAHTYGSMSMCLVLEVPSRAEPKLTATKCFRAVFAYRRMTKCCYCAILARVAGMSGGFVVTEERPLALS